MSAMSYPPEWPGFEIIIGNGEYAGKGAIVEGVEPMSGGYELDHRFRPDWGIGVRVPDERDLIKDVHPNRRSPTEGWVGLVCRLDHVRPLTPAARAMLKIARGK